MTDCVSRIERSSGVSVASVTTASSRIIGRAQAQINVTLVINKTTGTHLETGYWQGGPGEAY